MLTALMFSFVLFPVEQVHLEDLGVYRYGFTYIHQLKQGYLVSNSKDDVLVVIDQQGGLAADYPVKGFGPKELQRHFVLGADEERIIVLSQQQHVLVFDHQLNLLHQYTDRREPPTSIGGFYHQGYYVLNQVYPKKNVLGFYQWRDNRLVQVNGVIAQEETDHQPDRFVWIRAYTPIFNKTIGKPGEPFQLKFYQTNGTNLDLMMEFEKDVSDLAPNPEAKAYIDEAYQIDNHFVCYVYFYGTVEGGPEQLSSYMDVHNNQGKLVKRTPMPVNLRLLPVINSSQWLLIDVDELTLSPFKLQDFL